MKQSLFLKGVVILVILATSIATGEGKNIPMKSDDSDGFFNPYDPDDLIHHYTTEEIDEYRWTSIDHDGTKMIATDREVVAILEKVRRNNSTTSFSEPHFPENHPPEKMMKKRTVFGKDGRYIHSSVWNPYCAIGQMENGCTAFLVGPYHAITSRHCVYDCSKREFRPNRGMYVGRNCYSGGIFMNEYETWTYVNCRPDDSHRDIAYILLDNTYYNSTCWMGYGYMPTMPIVPGELCGYPREKRTRDYKCMHCSKCGDIRQGSSGRLRYSCDTSPGMSGAPVFTAETTDDEYQYAYGVHTHISPTTNSGTQFTKHYFEWIQDWKCTYGGYGDDCD